jgi:HK97 family phage prohead protease
MPTLYGYFTRFDEWTEIDSFFEGNFMERIMPGAFKKTFREQTPKVLFQHGMDGMVGDKPLGAPSMLREEDDGPYYEVPLLDTSYNRDLIPGLEAGLYGASFRFSVMREEWVDDPAPSEHNPKGLPERSIKEVRNSEFGPVTFPAYPGATAAVRSMTDEYLIGRATARPETLRSILEYLDQRELHTSAPAEQEGTDILVGAASEDAAVVIEEAEAGAPVASTPLIGSRKAAPGNRPTPLYTGKSKKRKGWVL